MASPTPPWVHVLGADDALMAVGILFCVALIVMQVRLIRRGQDGPNSLRWWAIIMCLYAITLRLTRIAGLAEHSAAGTLAGEPVLLGFTSIMIAWAWKRLR